MRKALIISLIISSIFCLVGCDSETTQTINEKGTQTVDKPLSGESMMIVSGEKENSEPLSNLEKNEEYTLIKFSDMYETKGTVKNVSTMLKNLDGKKVTIKGYPAVQSPLDESFVYLNNQPYVTCPFCTIGDVTKLEVIPIYMANKSKIKYTENSLTVYGKLEVAAKVDSEGYTTQFRIYADKIVETEDTNANKAVNTYYSLLTQAGMIYDIQTLQMNIEYATNPEYMTYYDEAFQTGKSKTINKETVIKGIVSEYLGFDNQYGGSYLEYIKECPGIVKQYEPADGKLKKLNNELVDLYNKEIVVLEKYQNAVYAYNNIANATSADAEQTFNALTAINADNLKLYDEFTLWNNKLRE